MRSSDITFTRTLGDVTVGSSSLNLSGDNGATLVTNLFDCSGYTDLYMRVQDYYASYYNSIVVKNESGSTIQSIYVGRGEYIWAIMVPLNGAQKCSIEFYTAGGSNYMMIYCTALLNRSSADTTIVI